MKVNPKIGLRVYKTALAIFLCIIISNFFDSSPIYSCIAALISMESSVINSYKAGVNRMQGTILGVGMGLIFSALNIRNPLLISLGTIIIITTCNKLKLKKPTVLSTAVFLVMILNIDNANPLESGLSRAFGTFLGIVVSILVNYLFFPPKPHEMILDLKDKINNTITDKLSSIAMRKDIDSLEDLQKLIEEFNNLVVTLEGEQVIYRGDDLYLDTFINTSKNLEALFIYMGAIVLVKSKDISLSNDNLSLLSKITGIDSEKLLHSSVERNAEISQSEENIIFNYNIRKVLELYNKIF